jgi:hypothetical protein
MCRGSSFITSVIRSGCRRMMSFFNALSTKLTRQSAWFRSLGQSTESTIFLMWPKRQHTIYNTAFFTDVVMACLIQNGRVRTRRKMLKSWLIHMDNARSHNSGRAQRCIEASRAKRLSHPAYSSDLTPNNFSIFGHQKKTT